MTIERRTNAWTSIDGYIFELPVVLVPVENFAFPESAAEAVGIYLWIDVTVGYEQVRPAVVVNVDKECAPTQKLGICTQSRDVGDVRKSAVTIVVVERRRFVGEVGPDDIQPAVAVVVHRVGAHTGFFAPVFVVGHAGLDGSFRERAVVVVVEQQTGCRVAGYEDVWPAIVVEVPCDCRKTIVRVRLGHSRFFTYVAECAVSVVVMELVPRAFQTPWAAHYRDTFPLA